MPATTQPRPAAMSWARQAAALLSLSDTPPCSSACSVFEAISHHRWISGLAQGAAIHVPVSDRTISYGLAEDGNWFRSEEHTSELQSLMRNSYAVFCLTKKK